MISQKGTIRKSSIELLKVVGLFLVVLCHSLPLYKVGGVVELDGWLDLRHSTSSVQQLILIIFSHLGQVGNGFFLVSSAYFLFENNEVKKDKIARFVIDTFIVSIIFLFLFFLFRIRISYNYIISSIFPITFSFYWFITCYILLYAIHPWLNVIIKILDKRKLFYVNLWFFILYCCISFVLDGKYYYTQLVGFVVYYFFVSYIRLYLPDYSKDFRINFNNTVICLVGFVLLIICSNAIGIYYPVASSLVSHLETFINPFIVGLSISLFNLFNQYAWSNRLINSISSTSLLVFVISNNILLCGYTKPYLFDYIYKNISYKYISLICIALAVVTFTTSILIAMLYKKIFGRIVSRFCVILYHSLNKFFSLLFSQIDSLN